MTKLADDAFQIQQRGGVTIIRPAQQLEAMGWDLVEHAADLVIVPITQRSQPLVVVALDRVKYFGSAFLSLLLRVWKHVAMSGGMMVLSGATPSARELLRVTNLDTLWAIYDDEQAAVRALDSD